MRVQGRFVGFGISAMLFRSTCFRGAAGIVAFIWSLVFPSDFSRKYQRASTRTSFVVVRLLPAARRTSLSHRIAALSSAVRDIDVRCASSGMCFSLGRAKFPLTASLVLLHNDVIVQ